MSIIEDSDQKEINEEIKLPKVVKNHLSISTARRVTLADVALAAGVSPITVSRVLRGIRSVDEKLAKKVKKAAEDLAYVPDLAARALASRVGSQITVLVPLLTNSLFIDLLEAAHLEIKNAGFQMMMGITHYKADEEERILREQLAQRPAGLLITACEGRTAKTQKLLETCPVPIVQMMEISQDKTMPCVGFSQIDAAFALTNHLLEKGYKKIAFMAAQLDGRTIQRKTGWEIAMKAAGINTQNLYLSDERPSSLQMGAQWLEQILKKSDKPDAIFFCNDDLAQGAIYHAHRLGIKIPQEIAIAGFNDLNASAHISPSLTTVRTPRREIGENAAKLLLELIDKKQTIGPKSAKQIDLGFEVIKREST